MTLHATLSLAILLALSYSLARDSEWGVWWREAIGLDRVRRRNELALDFVLGAWLWHLPRRRGPWWWP